MSFGFELCTDKEGDFTLLQLTECVINNYSTIDHSRTDGTVSSSVALITGTCKSDIIFSSNPRSNPREKIVHKGYVAFSLLLSNLVLHPDGLERCASFSSP